MGLPDGKKVLDRFSRLDTIPACDIRTDGHLSTRQQRLIYAWRRAGNKKLSYR